MGQDQEHDERTQELYDVEPENLGRRNFEYITVGLLSHEEFPSSILIVEVLCEYPITYINYNKF